MIRYDSARTTPVSNRRESSSSNLDKVCPAVGIALAITVFFHFDLDRYLSWTALKENRDSLFVVTDANISIAVGMFIGVYPIAAGFSLPQAVIFTLPGEFLFSALLSPLFLNIRTTVSQPSHS